MGVITRICLYALLALGLNVVVGFAGLLDLGYVAFFGIGSYVYAFVSSPHFGVHWPFPWHWWRPSAPPRSSAS